MMKLFHNPFRSLGLVFFVLSVLALGITGCSSGGSSYTDTVDEGELIVSLTDAAGDFTSYTVDVQSLSLTKANGAVVEVLPLSTRIDFAQYTEMTEFLTAATIPSGTYVAATMTLDFSNADIWAENEEGEIVQIPNIVLKDENGDSIGGTTLEVTVELEDQNQLIIASGIPVHLLIDFDLQASNQVDFSDGPTLSVDPFLVADVDRTHQYKMHRVRGLLDEVNLDESTFSVILRPFYSALSSNHNQFGSRPVMTDEETVFQVDGETYTGQDGLVAMDGLDPLAPVVALGSLKFFPLRFEAWEVYAGSSVPGADLDVAAGWVTARSGNTLTVKGASLIRAGSSIIFNDEITIQIDDTTRVQRQISSSTFSIEDISVGQHIEAFGTMTNLDPLSLEMDASEGLVRMMITTVRGIVVSSENDGPAQLVLALQSIGKFRVGNFDFTGTGTGIDFDADPENYEISTGTMDLSGIAPGMAVKLKGFVEPFGMAPPDFAAVSIVDVTDLKAFLKIDWMPPTDTPFTDISADELVVNMEGIGLLHHLVRGCVVTDLLDLPADPVLVPADEFGKGLYVLKYEGMTEVKVVFENFVSRLEELLELGYTARKVSALGLFNDSSSILAADVVEVHLQ